ncbi:MAG: universal stress protein [Caldimicrobium sp.]|nr:universal stress protein [Caldimicrobium sp.]MCX7873999.1 universal stress protein [Caldimicrobium sp.]MDW8094147.1 universal stress protein [Caldimicrobium sp.]
MENTLKKILLCVDTESHNLRAQELALSLAEKFQAKLVCLYVVDAYPKHFTNEIYAINREECRRYLDESLTREGLQILENLKMLALRKGIPIEIKLRYGLPKEEILKELKADNYDLLIMGKKKYKGYLDRIRSFNLPKRLFEDISIPVLFAVSEEYGK